MKKLGFGCMRLPTIGGDNSKIDIEEFKRMADEFIAHGFTYFDTAYMYHGGKSEEAVRKAVIERYPRDRFTVTTKLPMMSVTKKDDMNRFFETQWERLGTEYFDYYWLHSLNDELYDRVCRFNAYDFILKKKAEGKVKHIGFSFHGTPALLDRILNEHPETEYVQLQLNYIDMNSPDVCGEECHKIAVRHGKKIVVMEPLKGGKLARLPEKTQAIFKAHDPDASVASWGIRYAASLENVITVLSGMSDMRQVEDNISYMENFRPLDEDEKKIVAKAVADINGSVAIGCTGCRYCVDGCPQNIAIPEYFALYNEHAVNARDCDAETYRNIAAGKGTASQCVGCGKCEKICPQHLPVRKYLKDVDSVFGK